MLFMHFMRLAASRTFCTAGKSSPTKTPMMAFTTSSSMSVKALSSRLQTVLYNFAMMELPLKKAGLAAPDKVRDNNQALIARYLHAPNPACKDFRAEKSCDGFIAIAYNRG